MPPLSPALDAAVERHWQEACAAHRLFNGRVFSADHVAPGVVDGHWTEYRRVVAQVRDPALAVQLRIRSLAVCGVVLGPDGVVLGRREARAAYQPGLWQLAPAGSVDPGSVQDGRINLHRALLAELHEELGLTEADASVGDPVCFVPHPSGVLDLCFRLHTTLDAPALRTAHATGGDGEYEALAILPVAGALRLHPLSPASRAVLRCL